MLHGTEGEKAISWIELSERICGGDDVPLAERIHFGLQPPRVLSGRTLVMSGSKHRADPAKQRWWSKLNRLGPQLEPK
jgi:hypothetical protein